MFQSLVALGALIATEHPTIDSTQRLATVNQLVALTSAAGRRSHWLPGAAIGFGVGAAVTYLVLNNGGSTAPCDRSANQDAMSKGACLGITVAGGAAGALLGALVGGLIKKAAPAAPVDQLRIVPLRERGLAVSLAVRF